MKKYFAIVATENGWKVEEIEAVSKPAARCALRCIELEIASNAIFSAREWRKCEKQTREIFHI